MTYSRGRFLEDSTCHPLVRMGWVLLCTMMLPWDSRALEDLPFIKAKHRTHPLIAYGFNCSPRLGEDKKYFR